MSPSDPTPECSKPSASWGTCIHALASGWILPDDLCPSCTSRFMAALDAAVGPLRWHENYLKRGEVSDA